MSSLSNLAMASNEKREQNIMILRAAFMKREVITVESAVKKFGYTEKTIIHWAKDGNIPLLLNNQPLVPVTRENRPKWLAK